MIDKVITSFAAAVTVGYGATQSFDRVSTAANTSSSVYQAAGGLLSADPAARASAEARMYQAAANLQPLADGVLNH
jgi:hypothetical protein